MNDTTEILNPDRLQLPEYFAFDSAESMAHMRDRIMALPLDSHLAIAARYFANNVIKMTDQVGALLAGQVEAMVKSRKITAYQAWVLSLAKCPPQYSTEVVKAVLWALENGKHDDAPTAVGSFNQDEVDIITAILLDIERLDSNREPQAGNA